MKEHQWLDSSVRRHCEAVAAGLSTEFAGVFSAGTVDRLVDDSLERWRGARVQSYIPVLLQRFVRERLRALGQSRGSVEKPVPEVLFVCVQNAGRSQMAAALLQDAAGDRVHVRSAGSMPGHEIEETVLTAMAELGINLPGAFPKPLTDEVVGAADVIVTMGCGDACPVYPDKRYYDWDLPDPAGASLEQVRSIRDEIARRVRALLTELSPLATG